jgi:predicted DsbA family dithiol-disulfide isomerase
LKTSDKHNDEENEINTDEHAEHKHEHTEHEHKHHEHSKHEVKNHEKAHAKKTSGVPYILFGVIIVVLLGIIIALLLRKPGMPGQNNNTSTEVDAKDKVKVEFYVMSQCPYGVQVENGIAPVIKTMGDAIDFHVDYILQEPSPGTFQSLHGEKEVKGNIVQLCAMKYYPDNYKWFDFIFCQNKDAANVDTNWQTCAQENGMDSSKLKTCLEGEEGKTLLRESMNRATVRQARGSPTMFIGNVAYNGGRDAASFQRAICQLSKSSACSSIPKCSTDADCTEQPTKEGSCINPGQANAECKYTDPVPVELIVLNDEKCGDSCDTTRIVQVSQQLFLGLKTKNVDISSEEGKALVEKYKIEVVPAYLYEDSVEQSKSWTSDLQSAFEQLDDGKYKLLDEVTGATYFVSEEARKAYYDAIGIVEGDNKPQIDFFVMSYCPYGNQAEEGVEPVYQLLKDKAIFNPRYVIYSNYQGGGSNYCIDNSKLCSMHGIQELNQNTRELCVNKYMGIAKWFEFALAMNDKCTSQNADTCWEAVATDLKLDVAKIKTCEKDEAVALLTAEKALGDKLKVSGSPTIFIDGDSYSGGRTPEALKTALCDKFDTKPSECSQTLAGASATEQAATATGGC